MKIEAVSTGMSSGEEPQTWLPVGPVGSLLSSHRHHITLRSKTTPVIYHSILLFNFTNPQKSGEQGGTPKRSWYAMVSQCPHLGAPLESAPVRQVESCRTHEGCNDGGDGDGGGEDDIDFAEEEDIEDAVVICPWHEYDFDLRTGESTTGLKACVYKVRVTGGEHDPNHAIVEVGNIRREDDDRLSDWDVTEIRAVSEAFPQNQMQSRQMAAESLHEAASRISLGRDAHSASTQQEPPAVASSSILPPEPRPKTLIAWACLILNTANPATKVAYTRMAADAFRSGECKVIGGGRWAEAASDDGNDGDDGDGDGHDAAAAQARPRRVWQTKPEETPPHTPPREAHVTTVRPGSEARRGKGGSLKSRIAMLHSLANIELWAIDLGWDIIARSAHLFAKFREERGLEAGSSGDGGGGGGGGGGGPGKKYPRQLPLEFYNDFVKLSVDEAKHFSLLVSRLGELGTHFGDLEVHQGLWETALQTRHSLTARLSLIHLVNEARGLDVNPVTILKFGKAGDAPSREVLEVIHRDEITHVTIAHRHLLHLCALPDPPLDPIAVFREEVRQNFAGRLKGPFNAEDRAKAGMGKEWYEGLQGERVGMPGSRGATTAGVQREEVAGG